MIIEEEAVVCRRRLTRGAAGSRDDSMALLRRVARSQRLAGVLEESAMAERREKRELGVEVKIQMAS